MKKGQFSVEFIIVLGALLTIIATTSIPLYKNSRNTAESLSSTIKAREAANEITMSLNWILGSQGAKQPAQYWLPRNVTKIEGVSIDGKLNVRITINQGEENILVDSESILSSDWEDLVPLETIKLDPDNRTLHKTIFTLEENKEVTISDKILERE